MPTIINNAANQKRKVNAYENWTSEGQRASNPGWYIASLVAQVVLFIPLIAVLLFYFHSPLSIIAVVSTLFIVNIVECITGSNMRTIISVFTLGLLNLVIVLMFLL